jgi:hypothetical protein
MDAADGKMPMEPCEFSWETLTDYADRRLDAALRDALDLHLAEGCAACRERLDWLADAVPALNNAAWETPPAQTVRDAHAIFRARRRKPSLAAALVQQIFDSRSLTPQMAGARGGGDGTFRLLYQANGAEIELYGETTENQKFYLIGQARSAETASALTPVAAILSPGDPVSFADQTMAEIQDNEFHFADMDAGVYVLTLWLRDVMVSIADVRVGV